MAQARRLVIEAPRGKFLNQVLHYVEKNHAELAEPGHCRKEHGVARGLGDGMKPVLKLTIVAVDDGEGNPAPAMIEIEEYAKTLGFICHMQITEMDVSDPDE
ncbi:hypothetical protein [uncultured Roseobacter sp.]|uniref:hypothetical protein n=1 Tax=uncultured Roseobacter sp. TaxID=114847 RepID=UPI00260C4ABC|nr:hypothetical protein [uncultured Roseobacter sp.]